MKPWRTWLTCLGMLGAMAVVSGCGGGDIPDPSSDGQATLPESAPAIATAPPPAAPAPKPAAKEEPPAEESKAEVAAAPAEESRTEVAAAPSPAPAEAPAPAEVPAEKPAGAGASAAPPDRGSATAEMLALATKDAAPPPAGGDAAPGAPGGPGGAPGTPGNGPPSGIGGPGGGPGMAMGMQGQMQGQMQQQQQQQQMQAQMRNSMQGMQNAMRNNMGPGGAGMPGGGPDGGSGKPPDFRTPEGAVQAFLDALKAHDLDRLTEATALRAQTESSTKHREMFKRIFDSTLSESELNNLAAQLDGYRIAGENPPKSTGRVDVILQKADQKTNAFYKRTLTVRREKKGWGVCDIGVVYEFKNQRFRMPTRRR